MSHRGPSVTPAFLARRSDSARQRRESTEAYLGRITHLHLDNRKIHSLLLPGSAEPTSPADAEDLAVTPVEPEESVDLPPASALHACTSLRVLYANGNHLTEIEGLDRARQLEQLYLQNNDIGSMAALGAWPHLGRSLDKLYLSRNRIARLEGCEFMSALTELHLDNQRVRVEFTFEPESMKALGRCLKVLRLNKLGLSDLEPLEPLRRLQKLELRGNCVAKIEQLVPVLSGCLGLRTLDLRDNPVCKVKDYRKAMILFSQPQLTSLDNKPISSANRQFVHRVSRRKGSRRDITTANPDDRPIRGAPKPVPQDDVEDDDVAGGFDLGSLSIGGSSCALLPPHRASRGRGRGRGRRASRGRRGSRGRTARRS